MLNILVTGAGSLIGLGILRALKASKVPCKIFAADYFDHAPGLYWADEGMIWPDLLKPAVGKALWKEHVLKIVQDKKIDLVLVGLDFEVEAFAEMVAHDKTLSSRIIVADPKTVAICKDKYKTVQFLKDNGFPYAESCLPAEVALFLKQNTYPVIVKPRFGFRSRHVSVVQNQNELSKALETCPDPVVQKYVGTAEQEYTCGTLMIQGKIISAIALRRDLKDGNTVRAYWDKNCQPIEQFIKEVAIKLNAEGPLNFQLRLTDEGPVIFEINPRFSGTTYMRALFGVNEVEKLIKTICLKEPLSVPILKEGTVLRYFEDQFISADRIKQWESK
jgi:carbamoyl-phosphate synthase large subunit